MPLLHSSLFFCSSSFPRLLRPPPANQWPDDANAYWAQKPAPSAGFKITSTTNTLPALAAGMTRSRATPPDWVPTPPLLPPGGLILRRQEQASASRFHCGGKNRTLFKRQPAASIAVAKTERFSSVSQPLPLRWQKTERSSSVSQQLFENKAHSQQSLPYQSPRRRQPASP